MEKNNLLLKITTVLGLFVALQCGWLLLEAAETVELKSIAGRLLPDHPSQDKLIRL